MTYRVHFNDGNVRLFRANGMYDLISHLCFTLGFAQDYFWKIEETDY